RSPTASSLMCRARTGSGPAIARQRRWLGSSSLNQMLGLLGVGTRSADHHHSVRRRRVPSPWRGVLMAITSSETQSLTSMDYKRVYSIPPKARAMTRYSAKQRRMRGIGRSKRRFLQLYTNVKRSTPYHSLSPYARSLLFELIDRYNGCNNGMI